MTKISIGRSSENDIVLEDNLVSGKHAIISQDTQGTFFLQDLGSTNGTWLNGELIRKKIVAIRKVDSIKVGQTELEWQTYFANSEAETDREEYRSEKDSNSQEPLNTLETQKARRQTRIALYIFVGLFIVLVVLLIIWYTTSIITPKIASVPLSLENLVSQNFI